MPKGSGRTKDSPAVSQWRRSQKEKEDAIARRKEAEFKRAKPGNPQGSKTLSRTGSKTADRVINRTNMPSVKTKPYERKRNSVKPLNIRVRGRGK